MVGRSSRGAGRISAIFRKFILNSTCSSLMGRGQVRGRLAARGWAGSDVVWYGSDVVWYGSAANIPYFGTAVLNMAGDRQYME